MDENGYKDDSVYQVVREQILKGELEPGLRISSVKLADALGVSRTPLREAFRLLERDGLVSGERNRMLHVADVSLDDLDELYALRIVNESAAVVQTVPRLTSEDIAELEDLLRDMDGSAQRQDMRGCRDVHRELHRKLCSGAGPRTTRIIEDLRDHSDRYIRLYGSHEARAWAVGMTEHERIVESCRERDAQGAAARLARHLAHTALSIFAVVSPESQPWRIHEATRQSTQPASQSDADGQSGQSRSRRRSARVS